MTKDYIYRIEKVPISCKSCRYDYILDSDIDEPCKSCDSLSNFVLDKGFSEWEKNLKQIQIDFLDEWGNEIPQHILSIVLASLHASIENKKQKIKKELEQING